MVRCQRVPRDPERRDALVDPARADAGMTPAVGDLLELRAGQLEEQLVAERIDPRFEECVSIAACCALRNAGLVARDDLGERASRRFVWQHLFELLAGCGFFPTDDVYGSSEREPLLFSVAAESNDQADAVRIFVDVLRDPSTLAAGHCVN